tara:strand:+ start:142 stop:342 length:201 start_codon:yes stop_codon:yes gene_type:complete
MGLTKVRCSKTASAIQVKIWKDFSISEINIRGASFIGNSLAALRDDVGKLQNIQNVSFMLLIFISL